jgi:hypothetical protein
LDAYFSGSESNEESARNDPHGRSLEAGERGNGTVSSNRFISATQSLQSEIS